MVRRKRQDFNCVRPKSLQLGPALCHPMECSPPGSSVRGILQARILEWVACPLPGDLPDPRIKPESLMSPALVGGFFTTSATWELCQHETWDELVRLMPIH